MGRADGHRRRAGDGRRRPAQREERTRAERRDRASRAGDAPRRVRRAAEKKDKKACVMFAADATLYSAEETETATETAAAKKPSAPAPADPFEGMSEEEFKARARSSGIDLDDPAVRREMEGRARARMLERRRREERAKAEELGIDLDDPEVKRVLELLDREERRKAEARDAYRAWARRWFDKTKWLNVQNVLYAALAVRGRARREASFFAATRVASRRVASRTLPPPSRSLPLTVTCSSPSISFPAGERRDACRVRHPRGRPGRAAPGRPLRGGGRRLYDF